MVNSCQKGKVGEREAVKILNKLFPFLEARRGRQFRGTPDSPDVITSRDDLHFEIKRVKSLNVPRALEQAGIDGGLQKVPVLVHRPDGLPWMLTINLEDLPKLIQELT